MASQVNCLELLEGHLERAIEDTKKLQGLYPLTDSAYLAGIEHALTIVKAYKESYAAKSEAV